MTARSRALPAEARRAGRSAVAGRLPGHRRPALAGVPAGRPWPGAKERRQPPRIRIITRQYTSDPNPAVSEGVNVDFDESGRRHEIGTNPRHSEAGPPPPSPRAPHGSRRAGGSGACPGRGPIGHGALSLGAGRLLCAPGAGGASRAVVTRIRGGCRAPPPPACRHASESPRSESGGGDGRAVGSSRGRAAASVARGAGRGGARARSVYWR